MVISEKYIGVIQDDPFIMIGGRLVGSNLDADIKLLYIIFMNIECGLSYRNLMLF